MARAMPRGKDKAALPVENEKSSLTNADREPPEEEAPTPVPKSSQKAEAEPPSEPDLETRARALRHSLNKIRVTEGKSRLSKELALKEEEDNLLVQNILVDERCQGAFCGLVGNKKYCQCLGIAHGTMVPQALAVCQDSHGSRYCQETVWFK